MIQAIRSVEVRPSSRGAMKATGQLSLHGLEVKIGIASTGLDRTGILSRKLY
jgi:hypothetical protein